MSLRADGGAFQGDNNGALIAPRESADVAHPHKLERCFFMSFGVVFLLFMTVALCAVSLIMRDLLADLRPFSGIPAGPVDHDYEYSHQNPS